MSYFCTRCGQPLADNIKFCPNCGTPAQPNADSLEPWQPSAPQQQQSPYQTNMNYGSAPQQPYKQEPYPPQSYQPQSYQQQPYQQQPYQPQPYQQQPCQPQPMAQGDGGMMSVRVVWPGVWVISQTIKLYINDKFVDKFSFKKPYDRVFDVPVNSKLRLVYSFIPIFGTHTVPLIGRAGESIVCRLEYSRSVGTMISMIDRL